MEDLIRAFHRENEYEISRYSLEDSCQSFNMLFSDSISNVVFLPGSVVEPSVNSLVNCINGNGSTIEEQIGECNIHTLYDLWKL